MNMSWNPLRMSWNSMRMNWNSCLFLLSVKVILQKQLFSPRVKCSLGPGIRKTEGESRKGRVIAGPNATSSLWDESVSSKVGQWQKWLLPFLVLPHLARISLLTLIRNGNSELCHFQTNQVTHFKAVTVPQKW